MDLRDKTEIILLSELEGQPHSITGSGEHIYVCPLCKARKASEGNTSYEKRKLYYNPKKGVGYCQVCNAVIVDDSLPNDEIVNKSFEKELRLDEDISKYNKQSFDLTQNIDIRDDEEYYNYVVNKRKISDKVLSEYCIKGTKKGLIKPGIFMGSNMINKNSVDFFQIRYLQGDLRYDSPVNSVKPLSLLYNAKGCEKLVICEGFFSSFSAYTHLGYEYKPLVLLGKTLTAFQKYQLKEFLKDNKVEEVACCLDGGYEKENFKLADYLISEIGSRFIKKVSVIRLPEELDPNDMDANSFLDCYNSRVRDHHDIIKLSSLYR